MTDAEFLDDLQLRASLTMSPRLGREEWTRLESIANRTIRLVVARCGDDWTVASDSLYGAVRLARREMTDAVTRRLKT